MMTNKKIILSLLLSTTLCFGMNDDLFEDGRINPQLAENINKGAFDRQYIETTLLPQIQKISSHKAYQSYDAFIKAQGTGYVFGMDLNEYWQKVWSRNAADNGVQNPRLYELPAHLTTKGAFDQHYIESILLPQIQQISNHSAYQSYDAFIKSEGTGYVFGMDLNEYWQKVWFQKAAQDAISSPKPYLLPDSLATKAAFDQHYIESILLPQIQQINGHEAYLSYDAFIRNPGTGYVLGMDLNEYWQMFWAENAADNGVKNPKLYELPARLATKEAFDRYYIEHVLLPQIQKMRGHEAYQSYDAFIRNPGTGYVLGMDLNEYWQTFWAKNAADNGIENPQLYELPKYIVRNNNNNVVNNNNNNNVVNPVQDRARIVELTVQSNEEIDQRIRDIYAGVVNGDQAEIEKELDFLVAQKNKPVFDRISYEQHKADLRERRERDLLAVQAQADLDRQNNERNRAQLQAQLDEDTNLCQQIRLEFDQLSADQKNSVSNQYAKETLWKILYLNNPDDLAGAFGEMYKRDVQKQLHTGAFSLSELRALRALLSNSQNGIFNQDVKRTYHLNMVQNRILALAHQAPKAGTRASLGSVQYALANNRRAPQNGAPLQPPPAPQPPAVNVGGAQEAPQNGAPLQPPPAPQLPAVNVGGAQAGPAMPNGMLEELLRRAERID